MKKSGQMLGSTLEVAAEAGGMPALCADIASLRRQQSLIADWCIPSVDGLDRMELKACAAEQGEKL